MGSNLLTIASKFLFPKHFFRVFKKPENSLNIETLLLLRIVGLLMKPYQYLNHEGYRFKKIITYFSQTSGAAVHTCDFSYKE